MDVSPQLVASQKSLYSIGSMSSASPSKKGAKQTRLQLPEEAAVNGISDSERSATSWTASVARDDSDDSIMGEVQERMVRLDVAMENVKSSFSGGTSKSLRSPTLKTWATEASGLSDVKTPRRRPCKIPFCLALVGTVCAGALLACVLMFSPLAVFAHQLHDATLRLYHKSTARQQELIDHLTAAAADASHSNVLHIISSMIQSTVIEPPDRAIETLWGTVRTMKRAIPGWNGTDSEERMMLSHRSLLELLDQKRSDVYSFQGAADYLYVGFKDDEFAGASVHCTDDSCRTGHMDVLWYDAPGGKVSNLSMWTVDLKEEAPKYLSDVVAFKPTERPWYTIQSDLTKQAQDGVHISLRRVWSELYLFVDGALGLTRTAPMADCKNYSCMTGVVGSDVTLPIVSKGCEAAWADFQKMLEGSTYSFQIDASNSGVFIVNHRSEISQVQEGILVGASDVSALQSGAFVRADNSTNKLVQQTSAAILQRFGTWNSLELQEEEQLFNFSLSQSGKMGPCKESGERQSDLDCMRVGTLSVRLDNFTSWLVVLVSPNAAFNSLAWSTEAALTIEAKEMRETLSQLDSALSMSAGVAFGLTTLFTLMVGSVLGTTVSSALHRLSLLLRRLGELDFTHEPIGDALRGGSRSRFRDVSDLQDAFCRLSRGIESFSRFVPEAVVRNILRGDERANRLHVSRRQVTIMFSDIKDFTSISESLCPRNLIFVLTSYLAVMSRIVESFEGVVAEILGDGLLVYWNTPLEVEDHAVKACLAALAMKQALGPLNRSLSDLGLPHLEVRIGLNTGDVLSGTFGSDKKMKFGCMGDPVNLASRLEGLCKVYGVGIVCSSMTHEHLQDSFICRKLDVVQVKGRKEPVLIYEVMGCMSDETSSGDEVPDIDDAGSESSIQHKPPMRKCNSKASEGEAVFKSALEALENSRQSLREFPGFDRLVQQQKQQKMGQRKTNSSRSSTPITAAKALSLAVEDSESLREHARQFEVALEAYQAAQFREAVQSAEALLVRYPADSAATRLLKMARAAEGKDAAHGSSHWTGISVMTDK
mmetsp:Transcript_19649/g.34816  ORF Transcript_19649/g.34816 Transcript_19649/m.34816 type:complete len:1049 (+) Transcript_19649:40-3186(+)